MLDRRGFLKFIGGAAVDATGSPLPEATVEACRKADAVYLAAVGGPKWCSSEGAGKLRHHRGP